MTTNHIAQLAQWWETAEKGGFLKGDTIITKDDDGYFVGAASMSDPDPYDSIRILARAPKPKPAWHDAVAVVATVPDEYGEGETGVWVRDGDYTWQSEGGICVHADALTDVTPLIEAKVTDEMVLAALNGYGSNNFSRLDTYEAHAIEDMRIALAAALGIETE